MYRKAGKPRFILENCKQFSMSRFRVEEKKMIGYEAEKVY